MNTPQQTFLVDCNFCQAKVAAIRTGSAKQDFTDPREDVFDATMVLIGNCSRCSRVLVARSDQLAWEGLTAEFDEWSEPTRVYPSPAKTLSAAVPKEIVHSVSQAEKCMQVGAYDAASVMFGRALESLCNDIIDKKEAEEASAAAASGSAAPTTMKRPIMLRAGLVELHKRKVIDDRLMSWSTQLQAFRNKSAHATGAVVLRQDAADLQTFCVAIIEYIYDLAQRYEEFAARSAASKSGKSSH